MPNLVVEYSSSVDERVNTQGLLEDLHQVLIESGLFEVDSIKSRAQRYHSWLIGEKEDSEDFIHLNFEMLSGRDEEQKRELGRELMSILEEQASTVYSLTINIRDMDKECFIKVIN